MQVYFKCILLNFAMFAGYKFERKNFKLFIGGSTASNACGMQGYINENKLYIPIDRKSTRLNSSHYQQSRMPSSA